MHTLQRADKVLGLVVCLALQPLRVLRRVRRLGGRRRAADVRRVLMIKFWGIGSIQVLTAAAASLRRRHAGAELTLLTLSANEASARAFQTFDRILTLDVEVGWLRIFTRILGLVRTLRAARFDVVYDFEFFTRFSAVVTTLTGAPETRGFASPNVWRGEFHTHQVPFNRYWHVARNFRVLAGGESAPVEPHELAPLGFDDEDVERVERLLATRGIAPGRPYAVLNPNAGQLSLERRWPPTHFATLARRLALEDGLAVCLIGSSAERVWTAAVAERAAAPEERDSGCGSTSAGETPLIADLAGELTLPELAALFAAAACVVTNDSGPMHLAAALGAPTVGLFGPETPVMYAPIGERARSLYAPPPCSPCINVHDNKVATCIYGRPECLVNIDVERVHACVRELRSGEFTVEPAGPRDLPPAVRALPSPSSVQSEPPR